MAYTKDTLPYDQFLADPKYAGLWTDGKPIGPGERERAWAAYTQGGSSWQPASATPTPATTPPVNASQATQVVAGSAQAGTGQINVTDYAGQVAVDPSKAMAKDNPATPGTNESMFLSDQAKASKMTGTEAGTNINAAAPKYGMDTDALNKTAAQASTDTASQVDPRQANTYDVDKTQDKVAAEDMTGANGQVSDDTKIDESEVPQIDVKAISEGTDPNGVGQALADYAAQDFDDVDSRATAKGQLEQLQSDFVDADGNPKIPVWAQATARSVGRMTAFTGKSGTAATAAMATALMEATVPVAMADAQFFQTLTIKNLDNKQASIINKANVLSKMEMDNADSRMAAVIENSKNFMAMDLANLSNDQQAAVINNQNRVQSILEDSKAENAKRLFTADSQNNMDKFYDELNSSIDMYNATQTNNMSQYNTSQTNDMAKFNADMENNREQFYKNMQFQIDTANAKWRQTVTLQEDTQAFEAAATDVKNMVGISTEQLNRLWDRSDAMLDYAWKSTESQLDRNAAIALHKLDAKLQSKAADQKGFGEMLGTIGSTIVGSIFK